MSVVVDKREHAQVLVIAFTGFNYRLGVPVDEFFEAAGLMNASKIVVTDETRMLTFAGVSEKLDSFEKVCDWLADEVAEFRPGEVIVTGNSGGAFNAILYGHLLKADRVVSFGPLTYLDEATMRAMGDPAQRGFARSLAHLDLMPPEMIRYQNLKQLLADTNGVTEYFIHVSRHHRWDSARADYLRRSPNVTIQKHPYFTHAVLASLIRDGELSRYFAQTEQRHLAIGRHLAILPRVLRVRVAGLWRGLKRRTVLPTNRHLRNGRSGIGT